MKLIAGLGNPGLKYKNTYHNTGFMAADMLAQYLNAQFNKKECGALSAHVFVNGQKAIIAKPQTFMNLSGESIIRFILKYKLEFKDIMIIYDDTDIDLCSLRIRQAGGAGTHNGMRNIVERLDSEQFARIRVGIGSPQNPRMDLAEYVLSKIPPECEDEYNTALKKAADAAAEFIEGIPVDQIMQKYND